MMIRTFQALTAVLFSCFSLSQSVRADAEWDQLSGEFEKAMDKWVEEMEKAKPEEGGAMAFPDMSAVPKQPSEAFRPRIRS